MSLQQMTFLEEPDVHLGGSPVFQEDSHVSHIALSGSDWLKMMNGTSGLNSCGLLENFGPNTLLVKMLMASYQQYMSPFAPTWKKKVTKSGRLVYRLVLSERTMRDTGFVFLASPRASQDMKPIRPQPAQGKRHGKALNNSLGIIFPERIGQYINPRFVEWMMGFPPGWGAINDSSSECSAMEMQ